MARWLHGLGVSGGEAVGPVARLAPPPALPPVTDHIVAVADEAARAVGALAAVAEDLQDRAATVDGAASDVLIAQSMIAADPLRVIPSMMAGSAVTGGLSMAFGATSRAPHGGIWVVGLIGNPGLYVLAILAGMLIGATALIALKSLRGDVVETEPQAQAASAAVVPGNVVPA